MLRYGNKIFEFYGMKAKQANKIAAKKAYESGKMVFILSPNISPNDPWQGPCMINKHVSDLSFENKVNHFTYYNCGGYKTKTPIFFVQC